MDEEKLRELRERIDQLDSQMVTLLDERAAIAKSIGAAKQGSPVYRPAREEQVLAGVIKNSSGVLSPQALASIYREIIGACRNIQQPLRVVYLGPEGTYSEEAARKQCGDTSEYIPTVSIDKAVRAVEAGEADIAVVPVENSTEGAVNRTLDLLLQTSLHICSEILLPIHHQLLSDTTDLDAIEEVVAHPQSLAQCRMWLDEHVPHAKRTVASSNAEAARMASRTPGMAAIAGKPAATIYNLPIVASNIEDDPSNTTRFLVLGANPTIAMGADKTSLVCSVPNQPGALHKVLAVLSEQGVNMVKLESRPVSNALWEYVFYIDVEGHQDDEAVQRTLSLLNNQTVFIKVLGSYPKGSL